ncbi:hypothetical protein LCGC14_1774730, partial [marine sediment metagenome]
MQLQIATACVLLAGIAAVASAAEAPGVVNPHLKTDRSVDFRTIDSIIASVVKGEMTDEQKVLAIFHVVRRNFVHGPTPRHLAYDFHKVQHVLGTGACLSMTTPLQVIYKRMGYKCQSWVHDGHHMMQVHYGGGWHCIDPHMNFYCYDRSTPRKIASLEQLQNDRTLAFDAVKEGRAGLGYLLCGDSPKWFAGKQGRWALERGGRWPKMKIDEPFGGITLRRGETYVRTWRPGKYWYTKGWLAKDKSGPFHHCRTGDRKDVANWPLYEPHVWKGRKGTVYRHWGVGKLIYKPSLAGDRYADAVVGKGGLAARELNGRTALAQADANVPGEVIFSVNCPYVITAGELRIVQAGGGTVVAAVSIDKGKTWKDVVLDGGGQARSATFVEQVNGSFEGYQLKLTLTGGAAMAQFELVSHFQLNRFSLPYLVPGKN